MSNMSEIEVGDMVEKKNENIIDAWKTGKVKSINGKEVVLDYCPPYGVIHTNNPVPIDDLKKIKEGEE